MRKVGLFGDGPQPQHAATRSLKLEEYEFCIGHWWSDAQNRENIRNWMGVFSVIYTFIFWILLLLLFCSCCFYASAAFLLLLLFCFCCFFAFVAFLLLSLFCFCCFSASAAFFKKFSAFCVFVFLLFGFVAFLPFSFCIVLFHLFAVPQPPPRHEICTLSPTPAPATKSIF